MANGPNCDTSEPPLALGGSLCTKGATMNDYYLLSDSSILSAYFNHIYRLSSQKTIILLYLKHDMVRTPDWLSGVPVYYNAPALQYNFVFIIFHNYICSLFLICALADNFSTTFLGNAIRSGIFLTHINSYFLSSLTTSIIYHSLSDFSCIALTPKILMYAISNIIYLLVITYHETACPYPL